MKCEVIIILTDCLTQDSKRELRDNAISYLNKYKLAGSGAKEIYNLRYADGGFGTPVKHVGGGGPAKAGIGLYYISHTGAVKLSPDLVGKIDRGLQTIQKTFPDLASDLAASIAKEEGMQNAAIDGGSGASSSSDAGKSSMPGLSPPRSQSTSGSGLAQRADNASALTMEASSMSLLVADSAAQSSLAQPAVLFGAIRKINLTACRAGGDTILDKFCASLLEYFPRESSSDAASSSSITPSRVSLRNGMMVCGQIYNLTTLAKHQNSTAQLIAGNQLEIHPSVPETGIGLKPRTVRQLYEVPRQQPSASASALPSTVQRYYPVKAKGTIATVQASWYTSVADYLRVDANLKKLTAKLTSARLIGKGGPKTLQEFMTWLDTLPQEALQKVVALIAGETRPSALNEKKSAEIPADWKLDIAYAKSKRVLQYKKKTHNFGLVSVAEYTDSPDLAARMNFVNEENNKARAQYLSDCIKASQSSSSSSSSSPQDG